MYLELLGIVFALTMGLMVKFDGINIARKNYGRWKKLNGLVSTRNNNRLNVTWVSVQMIIQACYINFLQYMNSTIIRVGPNTYEVVYVINGRMYKMIVKPQRGPPPVLQISNENQEDVTEKVLPYMGPNYNWHGNIFTPKFFDCETLTFELSDGTEHTYDKEAQVKVE